MPGAVVILVPVGQPVSCAGAGHAIDGDEVGVVGRHEETITPRTPVDPQPHARPLMRAADNSRLALRARVERERSLAAVTHITPSTTPASPGCAVPGKVNVHLHEA